MIKEEVCKGPHVQNVSCAFSCRETNSNHRLLLLRDDSLPIKTAQGLNKFNCMVKIGQKSGEGVLIPLPVHGRRICACAPVSLPLRTQRGTTRPPGAVPVLCFATTIISKPRNRRRKGRPHSPCLTQCLAAEKAAKFPPLSRY